jgi:hypothetical protein
LKSGKSKGGEVDHKFYKVALRGYVKKSSSQPSIHSLAGRAITNPGNPSFSMLANIDKQAHKNRKKPSYMRKATMARSRRTRPVPDEYAFGDIG